MKKFMNTDNIWVADTETTVEQDPTVQEETEAWSVALCEVTDRPEPEDVEVYNNMRDYIGRISHMKDGSIIFYHNLKFDASFLLNSLNKLCFTPAWSHKYPNKYAQDWEQDNMPFTYKVCVSSMGQWYSCRIRFEDRTVEIRDSLKKIPSTLKEMGKSFHTKYQKLEMQYEDSDTVKHKAGGKIDENTELPYIINDVLVLAEAMYIVWYKFDMKGMTIGSDCLKQYKDIMGEEYKKLFPDMTKVDLSKLGGPNMTAYEYCVKAYSGGWCWLNPVAKNVVYKSDIEYPKALADKLDILTRETANIQHVKNIIVVDVNSLYPSVMSSECKTSYFPVGLPEYHKGEPKNSEIKKAAVIRRFKCRFHKKPGYLPFIHIRGSKFYDSNECLVTSDVNGSRYVTNRDGEKFDTLKEYTMTQVEFDLFSKHYKIADYQPIDYLVFEKRTGIFDAYIEKFKKMKIEATKSGDKALRMIAKLYLNNLYGKMGSTTNSSYKIIHFEDDVMKFKTIPEYDKNTVFMPVACYVTSLARRFTITAGQQNYFEGKHKGVLYADTDSLHIVDMNPDELQGVPFHSTDFCKWACEESSCAYATYAKQKTYIEVATEEDFETVTDKDGNPTYNLIMKAAGLGKNGKQMFIDRLDIDPKDKRKLYLDDFRTGLKLERGNLKAKQIKGGVILIPTEFKLS